ncbi:UbiA family prenyltransferase [Rhodobacteraceae bacterium WD3A24]|nr:UbiA family prenyltransferase [Rhodobacteraceae bacterium WD3A24]
MHAPITRAMVLVVDLDGTLIRSDMLLESFWAGFAADWRMPLAALAALRSGRAALKRRLAETGAPDAATLPYDDDVLAYVNDWRARGGRTALVTASDGGLARRVATHLGLFDEVHGSDGHTNLKGPAKAAFLTRRFGAGGYVYMGDSTADLPVWQDAGRAVSVGAPVALRARLDRLDGGAEHIGRPAAGVSAHLRAMRPHQWLKNLLVFVPMIADQAFTLLAAAQSALAFIAFALMASGVYVLNDLLDLGPDRAHPRKRARPFASGALPLSHGTVMAPALLLAGLAVSAALGRDFLLVMLGYFLATTAYSLWLKRRMIIDICVLAGLYTLRIAAGGAATGTALSVWLLAFSIFFFFALAAVKRQAELVDASRRGLVNTNGRGYEVSDLPLVAQMATASGYVSVLVMALYLNAPEVQARYSQPWILWGVGLILLYWISRIVMIAHRGAMHDDPVVFAAKDRVSRISLILIAVFVIGASAL